MLKKRENGKENTIKKITKITLYINFLKMLEQEYIPNVLFYGPPVTGDHIKRFLAQLSSRYFFSRGGRLRQQHNTGGPYRWQRNRHDC